MTERTGHMGDTFRHLAGGVDAVEGRTIALKYSPRLNEFSVQDKFKEPVTINGERMPGINFELVHKAPGDRVTGFQLLRERLINTSPRAESGIREAAGLFIVKDECPQAARTLPTLPRNPKNLDDVNPDSESHIYDATRYALQADRTPRFSTHRRQIW